MEIYDKWIDESIIVKTDFSYSYFFTVLICGAVTICCTDFHVASIEVHGTDNRDKGSDDDDLHYFFFFLLIMITAKIQPDLYILKNLLR